MLRLSPDQQAITTALQRHRVLGQLDAAARAALLTRLQPRHFAARESVADADSLAARLGLQPDEMPISGAAR